MKRSRMSLWLGLLRSSLGPAPPPPRRYFSSRRWPAARGRASQRRLAGSLAATTRGTGLPAAQVGRPGAP